MPASLLPKLRDHYAEFLDHVSLVHLRLLASPTCVGFRYGHHDRSPHSFSCLSTPPRSALGCPAASPSLLELVAKFYQVRRPSTWPPRLRSSVPVRFITIMTGPDSQPAFHRLRLWGLALGPASPCADCHGAGTLGLPVSGVFTLICAYSFRHPHFWSLHASFATTASQFPERSPTPHSKNEGQASAGRLIPTILGAFTLDE